METNDIMAGTYLLVSEFWDEYLSKPGEPFDFIKHKRGEILELNVEEARRLVLAQAVIPYDPDAPTHVVNADGSISEIPAPAEALGLVITEEQMAELGIPADATSEDVVQAIAELRDAARAQAAALEKAEAQARDAMAAAQAAEERAAQARQAAPPVEPVEPVDRPESDKIGDILKWVGSDKVKASLALEGEKSTKGDKARPQLVGPLEEILTNPGGA